MRTRIARTKPRRRIRHFPDTIDEILWAYGPRVRSVALWRQLDGTRDEWTKLGRLLPKRASIEHIAQRFGGGWYRAMVFGPWNRNLRREECLAQLSFGIHEGVFPMTAETRERIRMQHGI